MAAPVGGALEPPQAAKAIAATASNPNLRTVIPPRINDLGPYSDHINPSVKHWPCSFRDRGRPPHIVGRPATDGLDADEAEVVVLNAAGERVGIELGDMEILGEGAGRSALSHGGNLVDALLLQEREVARVEGVIVQIARTGGDDGSDVGHHGRAGHVDVRFSLNRAPAV